MYKLETIRSLLDEYRTMFVEILPADTEDVDGSPLRKREEEYRSRELYRYVDTINLVQKVEEKQDVLDIGFGFGHLTFLINRLFNCKVYGIETQNSAHEWLKQILENEGIEIKFCDLTKEKIPFKDNSFDLVLFCEVLEHLPVHPAPVINEINRVLRNKGNLILEVPNFAKIYNRYSLLLGRNPSPMYCSNETQQEFYFRHHREYTMDECISLLQENGFEIMIARFGDYWDKLGYCWDMHHPILGIKRNSLRILTKIYPPFRGGIDILATKL